MILIYFLIVFIVGFVSSRKDSNNNDYLFSSRKITLPSFVATIVTTWYGGILEIGRFTYYNGIVTWIIFCLFYYISAIIFAFFIGPKIHSKNITSIPHYFYNKCGFKFINTKEVKNHNILHKQKERILESSL